MISIEKGRGIFVKGLTEDSVLDPLHTYMYAKVGIPYVLDFIEARLILEPGICKYAALNRTEEDLKRLKNDIYEMEFFEGDAVGLSHLDVNFHMHICKAAQNHILELMLSPIHKIMPMIKTKIISSVPEARDSALLWHRRILAAIEEGNPHKAFEEMANHLLIAREHAEKMIQAQSNNFNLRS